MKSFSFDIKEDWFWTYLPVYVKDKGKYTVELYNEDDVFINARDLLIR